MKPKNLLKNLITIPSYLDKKTNESKIAEFLFNYFEQNLPWMELIKQPVEGNRFNLLCRSSKNPKLFFISHMDTVLPVGNTKNRLTPKEDNGKLFGLGSVDMKAGLAASIASVEAAGPKEGVALLFDCGEEYYFKGINKFIKAVQESNLGFSDDWKPEITIFPEPSNLKISNGCRGVLEIELTVKGKTCHAGRPEAGVNAVIESVKLIENLKEKIQYGDIAKLGSTTVNLANMEGGLLLDGKITVRPNAVPDISKFILDIRTANPKLTAEKAIDLIKEISKNCRVEIIDSKIRLNYSPYYLSESTDSPGLSSLEDAIKKVIGKVKYQKDISQSGYGEIALVGSLLKWNTVNFGPMPKEKAHQVDEYVDIDSFYKTIEIYSELIKRILN